MTIVRLHDFVRVSISASLKSFLLIMCIDARESTTNSRSSGSRFNASKEAHLFSESEKNVTLSCSWTFNTLLTSFNAASRAPSSCQSMSYWDWSSTFGAFVLRWWGSPGQIYPSEGFWSRILAWRAIAFLNLTRWIVFGMSVLFRRIDFGGVMSWNTQPNWRASDNWRWEDFCPNFLSLLLSGFPDRSWYRLVTDSRSCHSPFFNKATALLSLFDLDHFVGCASTWRCANEHFSPKRQPFLFCRTSIPEGAIFHKMSYCKFLWGNPCKAIATFYHSDFYLWDFGSLDGFRSFCCMKEFWDGFDGELFPRLSISWRKLQLFPFTHCLLASHCQQSPIILCTRCFVPWFLTTAFFSKFPLLAPKFLFRISCSILLFTIVFNLW